MLEPGQFSILLLAAGHGERMSKQAKIAIKIDGISLLEHCLGTLQSLHSPISVAVPMQYPMLGELKSELTRNGIDHDNIQWQTGGVTRQQSVEELLKATRHEFIFLHEVARPFINLDTCKKLLTFFNPDTDDALALCQPFPRRDVMVEVNNGLINNVVDVNKIMRQQTPQIYRRSALIDAYKKTDSVFPSTSLLMLNAGYQVKYLTHSGNNLKITYPEDLC